MRPVLNIPSQLDVTPDRLQGEVNRLLRSLDTYGNQVNANVEVHPDISRLVVTGTSSASYEAITRVSPALDTTSVTVTLPPPRTQDGGRSLGVARVSTTGLIRVTPTGSALLNGRAQMLLYGLIGVTWLWFDGQNWYSDNPGYVGWGGP